MAILFNSSRRRRYMGGFQNGLRGVPLALAFAAIGFFGLRASHAATYVSTAEAETGSLTGNYAAGDIVGASNNTAVKFGRTTPSPTPTPPPPNTNACALPKYPTAACTGVPAGTTLTMVSGDYDVTTPGAIIDSKHITGMLHISADNVTVKNSQIDQGIQNDTNGTYHPFIVTDTTIGPASGCFDGEAVDFANYTATRVYVRNTSDGFRDSGDNILIQDSFVYLCGTNNTHSDGVQGYLGGHNVVIKHNTIDQRNVPLAGQTAPIFIAGGSLDAGIQDNLLISGSYTIRVYDSGGVYSVTGNQVVNGAWQFGPVDADCSKITWSNNKLVTIDASYGITSTVGALNCAP